MKAWKCGVCGYVHRQAEPPEWCPVCGSVREEFRQYVGEALSGGKSEAERWRCLNCTYLHAGSKPPTVCPVCSSPADRFEPLGEATEPLHAAEQKTKVAVVGGGIAGVSAVESLRATCQDAEITLISKEPDLPYYRLNLTRYLAGEIEEDSLPIHPESWYEERNVRLALGSEVSSIGLEDMTLDLCGGEKHPFEKLVLTVGAHPFLPPLPGANREGVTSLRSLDHAKHILSFPLSGAKCVCIGGGLLGLETAGALARRGAEVTMLEGHGWLLPRQLSQKAGEKLRQYVADAGIKLRTRARTAEVLGDERVQAVLLEDGDTLQANLVVIATGIRPNSYLARLAGLEVNQGVVVDNHLLSSHPSVLAAGDVAEHRGTVYGIWGASQYQGSIAGMNAVGLDTEFGGIPRSNTLKVLGLDLFSIGRIEPEDASFEIIEDDRNGGYFRFVFRDSRLVGSILLGDAALASAVKRVVEEKADFSDILGKRPSTAEVIDDLKNKFS
jgi:nitrite reductase (NADH) large subunit